MAKISDFMTVGEAAAYPSSTILSDGFNTHRGTRGCLSRGKGAEMARSAQIYQYWVRLSTARWVASPNRIPLPVRCWVGVSIPPASIVSACEQRSYRRPKTLPGWFLADWGRNTLTNGEHSSRMGRGEPAGASSLEWLPLLAPPSSHDRINVQVIWTVLPLVVEVDVIAVRRWVWPVELQPCGQGHRFP